MPRKLLKSTSDDSHLAGDSKQSENKRFAEMAAEVTEGTTDDTHLADDSKRQENAAGSSGYPPLVQEDTRHMAANLLKSTSHDSHLAGDSTQSENMNFAGMGAEVTEGTSDDIHLADDSKSNVGRVGSDGPSAAREGEPPPRRNMMQQIELVMMNGELLTTLKREDLENLTVESLIKDLEQDWVTGADGAKTDDPGVFFERFSLVIRNEVFRRTMRTQRTMGLVTDYFPEGEESSQITLIKQPVKKALYKELRRKAEIAEMDFQMQEGDDFYRPFFL